MLHRQAIPPLLQEFSLLRRYSLLPPRACVSELLTSTPSSGNYKTTVGEVPPIVSAGSRWYSHPPESQPTCACMENEGLVWPSCKRNLTLPALTRPDMAAWRKAGLVGVSLQLLSHLNGGDQKPGAEYHSPFSLLG